MPKVAAVDFQSERIGWAAFLPILLFTICAAALSAPLIAQCSQAELPQVANSAQFATVAQTAPPPAADNPASSSSQTAAPAFPSVRFATGSSITVMEETPLQVTNDLPISSRTAKTGAKLAFTVTRDVVVDGVLAIPCGASVYGTIVAAKQAGRLVGASNLTLQLTALNLDGRSYPLYTPPFKVVGQSKTRPTVTKMTTGAAVGALAAQASVPTYTSTDVASGKTTYSRPSPVDQAKGYAVFAGVGAGIGTAIAASSPPSIAMIPAESQIEFTLASPIAVIAVDQRTAARLARGMRNGGPTLYLRGENQ